MNGSKKMSKRWQYGDMLRKTNDPKRKAMFLGWDGSEKLWVVMLYDSTYRFGEVVHWVVGESHWVKIDDR